MKDQDTRSDGRATAAAAGNDTTIAEDAGHDDSGGDSDEGSDEDSNSLEVDARPPIIAGFFAAKRFRDDHVLTTKPSSNFICR